MGYVGNQQTEGFSSIPAKQDLTGASGTTLTLTHAVASAEGIDLFINNVRQEPTTAYSVGGDGVTVTLTGSVVATDDIYVVYNSLARQTSTHPSNQALQATSGTFSGTITANAFSGDGSSLTGVGVAGISSSSTSGTAISIDANNLVFPKIPVFEVIKTGSQTLGSNTATKITFNTESYDTAGFYDLTNSKFQPTIAGYYQINLCLYFGTGNNQIALSHLYKNGAEHRKIAHLYHTDSSLDDYGVSGSTLVHLNGSTDYIEAYGTVIGSDRIVNGDGQGRETVMSGFLVSTG